MEASCKEDVNYAHAYKGEIIPPFEMGVSHDCTVIQRRCSGEVPSAHLHGLHNKSTRSLSYRGKNGKTALDLHKLAKRKKTGFCAFARKCKT